MPKPDVRDISDIGPPVEGATLKGCLLTTYDDPDPRVLTEDLFPKWLRLERRLDVDGSAEDRALFTLELERQLQGLRGCLSVFCSGARDSLETTEGVARAARSGDVFRFVRLFRTGRNGPAVQHAKLWLLRWTTEAGAHLQEHLQVVVSSCNLTRSAFRHQIQAAWTADVQLGRSSQRNLATWGVLPAFLEALGEAVGPTGSAVAASWCEALARAPAPDKVTFVGSVPGRHTGRNRASWGARALGEALGSLGGAHFTVLTPTIGNWTKPLFSAWLRAVGTTADRVRLLWVSRRPNALPSGRRLLKPTCAAFHDAGVKFLDYGTKEKALFGDATRQGAWPHAKVYGVARGRQKWTLITSANLSTSAWGVSSPAAVHLHNFELGVLLAGQELSTRGLPELDRADVYCSEDEDRSPLRDEPWVDASWDGRRIHVSCRPTMNQIPLNSVTVVSAPCARERDRDALSQESRVGWSRGPVRNVSLAWPGPAFPSQVVISLEDSGHPPRRFAVDVCDDRPPGITGPLRTLNVDDTIRAELECRLLEERYGGAPASRSGSEQARPSPALGDGRPQADYGIPVIVESRQLWRIVDGWVLQLSNADAQGRREIIRDGVTLVDHWRTETPGRATVSTLARKLAADELGRRVALEES